MKRTFLLLLLCLTVSADIYLIHFEEDGGKIIYKDIFLKRGEVYYSLQPEEGYTIRVIGDKGTYSFMFVT